MSASEISKCYDLPVGAEYFIYEAALNSKSSKEFFEELTTKTYTYSRLRRIVLYSAFGTDYVDKFPLYTSLLGANNKGREFIKSIRKSSSIVVLTKLSDYKKHNDDVIRQFEKSSKIDRIHMSFLCGKAPSDYIKRAPYII